MDSRHFRDHYQILHQILHPNALPILNFLADFMAVRKPYSGIPGWIISGQNDGFIDGHELYLTLVLVVPLPNISHR